MAKWLLFCDILPNLVVPGAYCVKVADKAITMDNLRLLCLVVNVCKGTARRPRYEIPSRLINSRLSAQYLPSYRLDIRSRIWAFDWYNNRWPWMTLNGELAFILRYFKEFGSFRGILCKRRWLSHNYGQFTITMSSKKRLQRDRATPTVWNS